MQLITTPPNSRDIEESRRDRVGGGSSQDAKRSITKDNTTGCAVISNLGILADIFQNEAGAHDYDTQEGIRWTTP